MALHRYDDGGKYDDGGTYSDLVMQLRERFALVDRAANNASNYTTDWCLQSPDGAYWIPSITAEP